MRFTFLPFRKTTHSNPLGISESRRAPTTRFVPPSLPPRALAFAGVVLSMFVALGTAWAHRGNRDLSQKVNDTALYAFEDWFVWDFHPSIFLGTATLIVLYTLGVTVWREKYNLHPTMPPWSQMFWFYASMTVMYLSLDGVMHYLSDELSFAAHMAQHLFLQMIFPPMLIVGIPGWLLRPLVRPAWVQRFGRWISHPVRASILFNATMWGWHIPEIYGLALVSHPVHIFEHLMFMATAVIFWWPILSPIKEVPRASLHGQLAYIFLNLFPMKALGLIIAVHNTLLYDFYASQPRLFGLSPIGDQRAGGLMMWVIGGLPLWCALVYLFVQLRKQETKLWAGFTPQPQGGR